MSNMNDHGAAIAEIGAFYDALAPDYDQMTGMTRRFVRERPFFRLLVERYRLHSALDAGSGTGFHSLLLSQLGVKVTAVDLSQEMLDRLTAHAGEMGLRVETLCGDFLGLEFAPAGRFDAIFSMGNTLPHLLTDDALRLALANFHRLLQPGGMVFIQLLNYDRILRNRERVQSVRELGPRKFVRFYEYEEGTVLFNLLTIDSDGGESRQKLESIPLRPLLSEELKRSLEEAGFEDVTEYGAVTLEQYDPETSTDLFVIARRGG